MPLEVYTCTSKQLTKFKKKKKKKKHNSIKR